MSFYPTPHEMSVQPVDRQAASSSKRKQLESPYTQSAGKKRRSDGYDDDADDPDVGEDGGAGGARHWTDDEKTKLFRWLMGPNEDEHFDALRTKKNTCFRDVSHPCAVNPVALSDMVTVRIGRLWWQKNLPSSQGLL
jgi:hypothetical protein